MTISAKIIAHSRHPLHGSEDFGPVPDLITFELRYPRFIHAEVMTHRVFSRNASSSRAIPVARLIADIIRDTAMPIHWGKNQRGMQADGEHNALLYHSSVSPLCMLEAKFDGVTAEAAWLKARDNAVAVAEAFDQAGYHKQVVNRLLEPFSHINVVVTASNFDNFFWLRRHPDAQPEIKELADRMWEALQASTPTLLTFGQYHLPYVTEDDKYCGGTYHDGTENPDVGYDEIQTPIEDLLKVSVARCARVSYLTHDGRRPNFMEDLKLYDQLVGSAPLHASPAEHQATIDTVSRTGLNTACFSNAHLSGNFDQGWIQYRKTLPGEYHRIYEAA